MRGESYWQGGEPQGGDPQAGLERVLDATPGRSNGGREPVGRSAAMAGHVQAPLVLVWLAGTAATVLASRLGAMAAVATFLAAAGAAIFIVRLPLPSRLLTAAAMAPALLGDAAPAWPWLLAGAGLILAGALGSAPSAGGGELSDVQRGLERCRRRAERAQLLVLRGRAGTIDAASLAASFRVTDAVDVKASGPDVELDVLVEDGDGTREGLERRLLEGFGSLPPFGWATFPDDGVTLEVLQDQARQVRRGHSPAEATTMPSGVAASRSDDRTASL